MSDNSDGLIKSFVIGAVIGGIAAVCLAPCRGKDLRDDITSCDIKTTVQEFKEDAQERTVNLLHIIKDSIDRLIKRIEEFANQGVGALLEDEIL